MVAFEREPGKEYKCNMKLINLNEVANKEKKIPDEWILPDGKGLTQDFVDYALPLIQGETTLPKEDSLPRFAKLKKVFV
jgi:6-phosphofructokinase 1